MSIIILGLVLTKPVFGVSVKARLKPVSLAPETSYNIEMLLEASLCMVHSNQRITKALIRLCVCAGWSASLLFANPRRQVLSRQGPYSLKRHGYNFLNNYVLQTLKIVYIIANNAAFHLGLHCLQKYPFRDFHFSKD